MPHPDQTAPDLEPRWPLAAAVAIFAVAALTLCWPMLDGQFLAGRWSDQFEAGYSFRHFAAQFFREHGRIPLWNPYLFGGLPFVGAAHGDIFYPTAWLRWVLPTDVGMNLGFALHIVLAGITMYGFLRGLGLGWMAAVIGGVGYELSGMVASQVHPGHDGKLFVSAMAPLLLHGILLAVRDRRIVGFGVMALATGLALHGHPQTSYYLLVAGAVWGAFLLFDRERGPRGAQRITVAAGAAGAVALGIGLYAAYMLPMLDYVPFSPRAEGGASSGWEYMTAFSMPVGELVGLLLPQFDGVATPTYFGANPLKLHGEYLGPIVLVLAGFGLGGPERRRARIALTTVGGLFLLVALGRHTPFYRLWYEFMPMMQKVRAPGMAFYLTSLVISTLAGFGADRLLRSTVAARRALVALGVFAAIGALAAAGLLQGPAEDMARSTGLPGRPELAIANAGALRAGGLRLLAAALVGGAIVWAAARRALAGPAAFGVLLAALVADLWSVDRRYFVFSPGAESTYASDPAMARVAQTPLPYRAWAPEGAYGQLNPYPRAWLMAAGIPTLFGYHGNEIQFFDELFGGKNDWRNQVNPNLMRLYAVRFALLNQPLDVPGFHPVGEPAATTLGDSVWVYEADSAPPYAWVVRAAAKLAEDQLVATVNDPRFPVNQLAVYPDTTSVIPAPIGSALPDPSDVTATVSEWRAGRITVRLNGAEPDSAYLLVAENWYKDWRATIDGRPVPVHRANFAILSVVLPPGAQAVTFEFDSPAYRRGRAISLLSLAGTLVLLGAPLVRRRRDPSTTTGQ